MCNVIGVIALCGTREDPISTRELVDKAQTNDRVIRIAINEARSKGIPVCATRKGYWISSDNDEIIETIKSLQSRKESLERVINGLLEYITKGEAL